MIIHGSRPPAARWPKAEQWPVVERSSSDAKPKPVTVPNQGRWRQERSTKSPEMVVGSATLAALSSVATTESPEVLLLKESLLKGKRVPQEPPLAVQAALWTGPNAFWRHTTRSEEALRTSWTRGNPVWSGFGLWPAKTNCPGSGGFWICSWSGPSADAHVSDSFQFGPMNASLPPGH